MDIQRALAPLQRLRQKGPRQGLAALLRQLHTLPPQALLQRQGLVEDELPIFGEPVQIEQMLINLRSLRRPLCLQLQAQPVELCLQQQAQPLELGLLGQGCGLANPANLFAPFYTTKPRGRGIGRVLARRTA